VSAARPRGWARLACVALASALALAGSARAASADEPSAPPSPPVVVVAPPVPASDGEATSAPARVLVEAVEVRGNARTLSSVVRGFVPVRPGEMLDVLDGKLALARLRLLGTGFFRQVDLSLRRGSKRGSVILVVTVVERTTIVVSDLRLGLGADTDASGQSRPLTAFGGIDLAETNFAGTGTTLGGALAVSDGQLGLRARFSWPQILGSRWSGRVTTLYNRARESYGNQDVLVTSGGVTTPVDHAIAEYTRVGGEIGAGYMLGPRTELFLDYRLEGIDATYPDSATHRRGETVEPIDFHLERGTSMLSVVRASLYHDTRDEPFLTNKGWLVTLGVDGATGALGSDYRYLKLQSRVSRYVRLPWKHVVELQGYAGVVFGDAPQFERFYVGDLSDLLPDRLLDLTFDRRPAPNVFRNAIGETRYGDFAARLLLEYRVPLYRGRRSIYGVDFFGSAGLYSIAEARDFESAPTGYTGAAKIPLDLTFNTGIRVDTAIGGLTVGVATLLGFLPALGGSTP
jgi:outer membrane protein assembly factor BamA